MQRRSKTCLPQTLVVCGLCAAGLGRTGMALDEPRELVVPLGLECQEGSGSAPEGGCTTFPDGWRNQIIISSSEFAALQEGDEPLQITGLAWRPDGETADTSETRLMKDYVLRLSTTDASPANGQHSLVFEANVGADETEVYRGDWETTFSNTNACGANRPKHFEYFLEFQRPFSYDPQAGDLVVDNWHTGCAAERFDMDLHLSTNLVMVGGFNDTPQGLFSTHEVAVLRFRFAPSLCSQGVRDLRGDVEQGSVHLRWRAGSANIADIDVLRNGELITGDVPTNARHFVDTPPAGEHSYEIRFLVDEVLCSVGVTVDVPVPPHFQRGECNNDGEVDLSDAVCILNWRFSGSAEPGCVAATNANGDNDIDIADASYLLNFLFAGNAPPPPPFTVCGPGTSAGDAILGCLAPTCP